MDDFLPGRCQLLWRIIVCFSQYWLHCNPNFFQINDRKSKIWFIVGEVELVFLELQYLVHLLMYIEYCLCVLVLQETWSSSFVVSKKSLVSKFFPRQDLSEVGFLAMRILDSRDASALVYFSVEGITGWSQHILVNLENQGFVRQYGTTISPAAFSCSIFLRTFPIMLQAGKA